MLPAATLAIGCYSPGKYGYSRTYSPLDAEETAAAGAVDYDPVMATRQPEKWRGKTVSVFGVVVERSAGDAGAAKLRLSMRTLEPRNLCDDMPEDTCRVTVSDREHATVNVQVKLEAEDDLGRKSVGGGSLVRVIGKVADGLDSTGTPTIRGTYYRHWPRGQFVTAADRDHMRK